MRWPFRSVVRFRLSLATLLLLVGAVGFTLLVPVKRMDENRRVLALEQRLGPITRTRRTPDPPWIATALPKSVSSRLWPREADRIRMIWIRDRRQVTDRDLEDIGLLAHLGVLVLPGPQGPFTRRYTGPLPATGSKLSDAGVRHLRHLRELHTLWLDDAGVGDLSLRSIGRIASLVSLSVSGTRITDDGLRHLALLPKLESLDLRGTHITDEGVRHLASLPRLTELWLSGTKITDHSAEILGQLKALEEINLDRTAFTSAGGAILRRLLPNVEVMPDTICPPPAGRQRRQHIEPVQ
jgi:hypothetical protein